MQKYAFLASIALNVLVAKTAPSQTREIFRVPFDGCKLSFGTGENAWYFCPDKVEKIKSDSVSPTDNALVQSLPVHGKLRVVFVCRSSEPVMTTITFGTQTFQLYPDSTLASHDFEVFLDYSQAGTDEWKVSSILRKNDYVSMKKGCYAEVSQNLSLVHIPTLRVYGEYLSKSLTDLTAVLQALTDVSTDDLSQTRIALDSAIKNIQAIVTKTDDAATKLLLNQSLSKLQSIQKNLSQSCGEGQMDTPLCTKALASARTKAEDQLSEHEEEATSLAKFLGKEVKRLQDREASVAQEIQLIKDGLPATDESTEETPQ